MRTRFRTFAAAAALAASLPRTAEARIVTALAQQPPDPLGITFLMTDGTVLGQSAFDGRSWYRLTPDESGSYQNGTWSAAARIPTAWAYNPFAFASAVLADGRLVVLGGEYNGNRFALTNLGAVYDPVADAWTALAAPPGWDYIGDSPSVVLPGGQFVVGRKLDEQMAMLDPATMQWTLMGTWGKRDFNSEEGWTLMPDGSILTVDVEDAPGSERYLPSLGAWIADAPTAVNLKSPPEVKRLKYGGGYYYPPGEVGPMVLRPDGTVFAVGSAKGRATGHTAIYRRSGPLTTEGTWVAGPDFAAGDSAGDSSAALLPSGHVLVPGANSGDLYEFDGSAMTVTAKGGFSGAFLMTLPSGQALACSLNKVFVYDGAGDPEPAWAPAITSVATTLTRGATYTLVGTQLNGLSQAAAFGDELETATNYPLVRLTVTSTGHVFYARTHDHSSMGVATGATPVSTSFDVPAGADPGPAELAVVANGITSPAVSVVVE